MASSGNGDGLQHQLADLVRPRVVVARLQAMADDGAEHGLHVLGQSRLYANESAPRLVRRATSAIDARGDSPASNCGDSRV